MWGNTDPVPVLILRTTTAENLAVDESLELLGTLIDTSFDEQNEVGLRAAIDFGERLEERKLNSEQRVVLYYFISNAWADLWCFTYRSSNPWAWEHEEVEKQIVYLRRALLEPGFRSVQKERRAQIHTNLGNLLNQIGRSVEALEQWRRAIVIVEIFGMARANYAQGLAHYGNSLHKPHDAILILNKALDGLESAVELPGIHPEAAEHFDDFLKRLRAASPRFAFGNHKFEKQKNLGRSKTEIAYRRWALENTLFLNHLNDVGENLPEAAVDNLTLPPLVRPIAERSMHLEGLINQIKQEFVSARYVFFEGIISERVHFSDRGVALYDTYDYPSYSLAVERIKVAFRLAYSILDKIAYFLNDYLNLNIPEKQVSFRAVWYEPTGKSKRLRNEFKDRQNWSLRGLFWLSKDLYEETFRSFIEPEAQELSAIRNHLEHKYLKVHEFGPLDPEDREDALAYSIGRGELTEKTLKMLQLVRSAIVYLTLSVHDEENARKKGKKDKDKVLNIYIDTWEDDWKF